MSGNTVGWLMRVHRICIAVLLLVALELGMSFAVSEGITQTIIDMDTITTISGNGTDEIEGGLITDNGGILLYGWTTSTTWRGIAYENLYESSRDALAIMVSPTGAIQWIITDGDSNNQCMYSFVGAAIIDDHILLCHRQLMDNSWTETYGITILGYDGTILKKYEFDKSLVVRDTCDAGNSMLFCGYFIRNQYRVPYIIKVGFSGELIWEYTAQPVSWENSRYTENSFESVVGNDSGICIGVLDRGEKQVQLVSLNSTGSQVNKIEMDNTTMNQIWLSSQHYGIFGYTLEEYIILYADAWGNQHQEIIGSRPLGGQIIMHLESDNSLFFLIEKTKMPAEVFCMDPAYSLKLSNSHPEIVYIGGGISDNNSVITTWGYSWDSEQPNQKCIVVMRANIHTS